MLTHPHLSYTASVGQRVKSSTSWWASFHFASSLRLSGGKQSHAAFYFHPVVSRYQLLLLPSVRLQLFKSDQQSESTNSASQSAQGVVTMVTMLELVGCTASGVCYSLFTLFMVGDNPSDSLTVSATNSGGLLGGSVKNVLMWCVWRHHKSNTNVSTHKSSKI